MITTLLKQKYQEAVGNSSRPGPWIKENFDRTTFIEQMAAEHNTTTEMIEKLLENCKWFK